MAKLTLSCKHKSKYSRAPLLLRSQCGFGPSTMCVCNALHRCYYVGRHQLTQDVACSKLYSTAGIQTTLFPAAWIVAGPVIVIDLHHIRPHHCNAVEKGRRPQKNYSHIVSLQTQILLNTSVSLRMSTLQCRAA